MNLITNALVQAVQSLIHNLPYLAAGILIAAALQVYLNPDKVREFLTRNARKSILLVILFATLTPFCSCGTMAVVIAMLASTLPWAPVVAFMVSSPLMSPGEFVVASGVMGIGFSVALLVASILIGLGAGWAADWLEKRGFLKNQARFSGAPAKAACSCENVSTRSDETASTEELTTGSCGCSGSGQTKSQEGSDPLRLKKLIRTIVALSPRLLAYFAAFALIGKFFILLFPSEWWLGLFGTGKFYGVPLAATLGLPLYLNGDVAMPLIKSFMDAGMSQGAALAFTISGAGTCLGAVAGALTIAKRRVVALVVASLWVGAILAGYGYNAILALF